VRDLHFPVSNEFTLIKKNSGYGTALEKEKKRKRNAKNEAFIHVHTLGFGNVQHSYSLNWVY
jgi:hypothetical protein